MIKSIYFILLWRQRRNICKPRLSCNEFKLNIKTDFSIWWQRRRSASSEYNIWLCDPLQPETKEQHAIVCRIHSRPPAPSKQLTKCFHSRTHRHALPWRRLLQPVTAAPRRLMKKTESGRGGGGRREGGRRNEMRGGDEQKKGRLDEKRKEWDERTEKKKRRRRGGGSGPHLCFLWSTSFARRLCENSIYTQV